MVYTGTTNYMKIKSIPAIALKESNEHGVHSFMSQYTVKCLHRYQWIEIPIDDDVIAQVRNLAEEENAKKLSNNYMMFEWAPGVLITGDVSEEDTPIREEE